MKIHQALLVVVVAAFVAGVQAFGDRDLIFGSSTEEIYATCCDPPTIQDEGGVRRNLRLFGSSEPAFPDCACPIRRMDNWLWRSRWNTACETTFAPLDGTTEREEPPFLEEDPMPLDESP